MRALGPFTGEDGDAFRERFRWLGIETPSEFQRIAAQSFAAFANQFLKLRQFMGERFITAFLLQARAQKIQIVLVPSNSASTSAS